MSDSTDPVAAYQAAEHAQKLAERTIRSYVQAIRCAAGVLEGDKWKNVCLVNVGDVGFPQSLAGGYPLDCANLPSGRQLADALAEWHRAKQGVSDARKALPE